jgi:site-specific recombinase XerD
MKAAESEQRAAARRSDAFRTWLRERVHADGRSPHAISRAAGVSRGLVALLLTAPARLPNELTARQLAIALGDDPDRIAHMAGFSPTAAPDRQILVERGPAVDLPPPALAIVPTYLPLDEVAQRFLASLRFGPPRTTDTYREALRRFGRFLASAGIDPFSTTAEVLPPDILEHFFRWLSDAGYSRSSIETHTAGMKAFLRFAVAKRLVPPHFSYDAVREGLRQVMGKRKYRSPRIDPRLALIVTYVDNLPLPPESERGGVRLLELLRDRALLHVLFYSGMRRAEVVSLTRQDVQEGWAHEALIVGKGDRERNVFVGEDGQRAIRAYLEARNDILVPLWLRHDNRRGTPGQNGECWRLSNQTVWATVKRYASAVGVPATTHHFRHLKASTLLNRGASLSEVQDVLGHANPNTTKTIYAHYAPKFLRAVVEKYSASPAELVAELEAEQERRRVVPGP